MSSASPSGQRAGIRCEIIPSHESKHTHTVIILHGSGGGVAHLRVIIADAFNTALNDPEFQHVRWVFPEAPPRTFTAVFGSKISAWFDVYETDGRRLNRRTDEVGISQSIKLISRLIDEEVDLLQSIHPDDDIDASRIVLIGYSQGGAMSLLAGLSHEERLAGLAVLSGRLPMQDKFKNMVFEHAKDTPIFWGHGTADPVVPYMIGQQCTKFLHEVIGIPLQEATGRVHKRKKSLWNQRDNPPVGNGTSNCTTSGATSPLIAKDHSECEDSVLSPPGIIFHTYEGLHHDLWDGELDDLKAWLGSVVRRSSMPRANEDENQE